MHHARISSKLVRKNTSPVTGESEPLSQEQQNAECIRPTGVLCGHVTPGFHCLPHCFVATRSSMAPVSGLLALEVAHAERWEWSRILSNLLLCFISLLERAKYVWAGQRTVICQKRTPVS